MDWANFTQRNKNVFLFNAITLCVMLAAQSYFWKREVWMITHLSEDNGVAYNNLPEEIAAYGEFEDAVAGYNRGAFYFALAVGSSVFINFIISTDFLINGDEVYNYNLGSRTITGLLTVRVCMCMCMCMRTLCFVLRCGVLTQARAVWVCGTEHDACQHKSVGLPLLRATILRKRMVRRAARKTQRRLLYVLLGPNACSCSPAALRACRAISMFSVVPLSYNTVDDVHKVRVVKTLSPIDIEMV